jgi:hypothetical protein
MDEDFSDLGEKVNNFRMDGIFASDNSLGEGATKNPYKIG